jgi:hypothetical protein
MENDQFIAITEQLELMSVQMSDANDLILRLSSQLNTVSLILSAFLLYGIFKTVTRFLGWFT